MQMSAPSNISRRSIGESVLQSWEGFLPPGAIVMGRHAPQSHAEMQAPAHAPHSSTPTHASSHELPFFFFASFAPGSDDEVLFGKITQALGLSASAFGVGSEIPAGISPQVCVRFGAEGFRLGDWVQVEVAGRMIPMIVTHSLESLGHDVQLKKEAWAHLKSACDRLGFQLPKK